MHVVTLVEHLLITFLRPHHIPSGQMGQAVHRFREQDSDSRVAKAPGRNRELG